MILISGLPILGESPTATNITTTSVTLVWNAWDPEAGRGDRGDGPIVGYYIHYEHMSTQEKNTSRLISSANQTQSLFSWTIEFLEPATTYHIYVTAVREGPEGEGMPLNPDEISVATLSMPTPPLPTTTTELPTTVTMQPPTSEPTTTTAQPQQSSTPLSTAQQPTSSGGITLLTTTLSPTMPQSPTALISTLSPTKNPQPPQSSTKVATDGMETQSQGKYKLCVSNQRSPLIKTCGRINVRAQKYNP